MSTPPTPFNITLTDTSPIFLYSPYQDGSIYTSWVLTDSVISDLTGWTTTHGTRLSDASVRLDWLGTAVYLYGNASTGAYVVTLDGASTRVGTKPSGLLFATSGLTYGPHSLTLRVIQNTSITSIAGAIITAGIGAVGTRIQNRTIDTTTVPPTSNDIVLTGTWYSFASSVPPVIATNVTGSAISFPISSASAFYIIGYVTAGKGPYRVIFTPPVGQAQESVYNGTWEWGGGWETIKYLATGLDRAQTYHVEVISESDLYYDQGKIVILDTPPSSSYQPSTSNPGSDYGQNSRHTLSSGAIVGIVVGCLFLVIVIISLFLRWRKRRQKLIQHDSLLPIPTVTSQSNHPTMAPSSQDGLSNQEDLTSDLRPINYQALRPIISRPTGSPAALPSSAPLSLPVGSPASPSTTGSLTHQDAQFFNNLYALNVPAAEIATMMEALRAEREASTLHR